MILKACFGPTENEEAQEEASNLGLDPPDPQGNTPKAADAKRQESSASQPDDGPVFKEQ